MAIFISLFFVDDSAAVISAKTTSELVKTGTECVSQMLQWCKDNGLVLNEGKII